jgi:anthranilate phosphoribosyltransferase
VASQQDVQKDALALLRVLAGKDTGPRFDIVCLNAAPLLCTVGKAKDLKQGLEMARSAVKEGRAVEKLRDWVTWQNEKPEDGLPTLEKMLSRI